MIANSIAICKSSYTGARSCSVADCMDLMEGVLCGADSFISDHKDTCGSCSICSLHLQFAVEGSLAMRISNTSTYICGGSSPV